MAIYGFKTYDDEKIHKINNPDFNNVDNLKKQLILSAKHHMFTKSDYKNWGNPNYGDDTDEKEEKKFSKNKLGYCYKDQGDNFFVYDFKKKKFVFFDHECPGNDNMKHIKSIDQVASYIKREISEYPDKYLMNESFNDDFINYNLIFEELQDRFNSGELTLEQAEEVNDLAYGYYIEKKTKVEYSLDKFKKKYNFVPDKPGSKTGTVTIDGKKHKVDLNINSSSMETGGPSISKVQRFTGADLNDGKINFDKNFFKLKGSNKNERQNAFLQHEIGHTRLHSLNADSEHLDKSKAHRKVAKQVIGDLLKDNGFGRLDIDKEIFDTVTHEGNYKKYKKISKNNVNKDERLKALKAAKKYASDSNHANAAEYEADRYAANKTNKRAIKKAVSNAYRLNVSDYEKGKSNEEKFVKSNFNKSKQNGEIEKGTPFIYPRKDASKLLKKMAQKDMLQRSKALNDKELQRSNIYK